MNEEKLLELLQKRVDEFIQHLEGYDRFPRSYHSLESAINWLLAISVGTLLWLLGSFYKFTVSNIMPNKSLFLLAVLCLGISTIFFAFVRAMLYLRQIALAKALENIRGVPDRVRLNMEIKTEEELKEMADRIGTDSIKVWGTAHNLICQTPPFIKLGLIYYIGGVVISVIYITIFVVKYL